MKQSVAFEQHFLARISEGKTIAKYSPKKAVFCQGDPADSIFYIETGRVMVAVVCKRGKEAIIALLNEGDFFGEGCLTGQSIRECTVTPLLESKIVRIDKATAAAALLSDHRFAGKFIAYLLMRNLSIQEDLVDQLFNSSEQRLARVLLRLANFNQDSGQNSVVEKISQATLAEMVGTTRSRVSHFMNKFRKLGLIKYNGKLEVHRSLLAFVLQD
jgi:CRP/FNR family transcriptional regulator, cyclic AMP receptor protein